MTREARLGLVVSENISLVWVRVRREARLGSGVHARLSKSALTSIVTGVQISPHPAG